MRTIQLACVVVFGVAVGVASMGCNLGCGGMTGGSTTNACGQCVAESDADKPCYGGSGGYGSGSSYPEPSESDARAPKKASPSPAETDDAGADPGFGDSSDSGATNDPRCPSWRPTTGLGCSAYQAVGGCRYELLLSDGGSCTETCSCVVDAASRDAWECTRDATCR